VPVLNTRAAAGPAERWRRRLAALAVAVLVSACASRTARPGPPSSTAAPPAAAPAAAARAVFPGERWERVADPLSLGYCRDRLDLVTARAKELPTTAMMVVVGGRVLYEYGDVTAVSYLASVRKSVLAMLFGNYVASGKIRLDKTLADLGIDDIQGLTAAEREATVADLLGARSGVYHPASNSGDNLAQAPPRGSQKHGTYFLYSNWDFNALGTIFEQETGQSIYDALERDLAGPIGMQEFDRSRHRRTGNSRASRHLAYHMNFSTRDMARIGYLMLREGAWAGRQIVPREWATRIVTPVTRVHEMNPPGNRKGPFGYGYLWWIWDGDWARGPYEGAYTGIGAIGQFITVLPKLDMVIAHKTTPQAGGQVGRTQYLDLVEKVIGARCGESAP
jgi:CubicO group peptidase (beta-lactamase class C family)